MKKVIPILVLGFLSCFSCAPADSEASSDAGVADVIEEEEICEGLADLSEGPLEPRVLRNFSGSEDFAFDDAGFLISVDRNGNLTRQQIGGQPELITPGFQDTAGIRVLANGDFILANVSEGSLQRVTADGGITTLLSGIAYPNGVEVDLDGFIYVAEHDAGRVRRVHPESGDFTIIAEGIINPNGLSFSPDYQTLYIGSFGGGRIHMVTRDDGVFGETELLAQVTEPSQAFNCQAEGAACYTEEQELGACEPQGGTLVCVQGEATLCTELDEPCTAVNQVESQCVPDSNGSFSCPTINLAYINACVGKDAFEPCSVQGSPGVCDASEESHGGDFLVCYADVFISVCEELEEGDVCFEQGQSGTCVFDQQFGQRFCYPAWATDFDTCEGLQLGEDCRDPTSGQAGYCEDGAQFGLEGVICFPENNGVDSGGLDGVAVDTCGNVYVTEFTTGNIYRITPDGITIDIFSTLPSSWIPNLHWGYGFEGFLDDKLYVMDRDEGRVFELDPGVKGVRTLYGQSIDAEPAAEQQ